MAKLLLCPLLLLVFLIVGSVICLLLQIDINTLQALLYDAEIRFALLLSLSTATASLLVALVLSIPAAWVMVRVSFRGKRWLDLCLDLPVVMPPLVAGIGLLLLLGQAGPVSYLFPNIARLLFSPFGVIVAQIYVASAILVRNISAAFASVEKGYLQAAYNLGLTPFRTLILVEIPLVWRAVLSSSALALARTLGEFGATLMLAGATRLKTETLPMAVYLNIASGDYELAVGCALLLMLMSCLLLLVIHLPERRRNDDALY